MAKVSYFSGIFVKLLIVALVVPPHLSPFRQPHLSLITIGNEVLQEIFSKYFQLLSFRRGKGPNCREHLQVIASIGLSPFNITT